jgi:hypothetical protein
MGAYSFDGVDDELTLASAPRTAAPLSFGAWFRSGSATVNQALVMLGVAGTADNRFMLYAAGATAGDPVVTDARTTTTTNAASTTGYSPSTWHSACGVYASTTSRAAFIDGGSKGTDTTSKSPASVAVTRVGRLPSGAFPMNGHIGYIFIWSVALSDAEVATFHSGTIPQSGSVVASYDLTQNWGGGPVTDQSGNGNNLTISGATFDSGQTPPVSYFTTAEVPKSRPTMVGQAVQHASIW